MKYRKPPEQNDADEEPYLPHVKRIKDILIERIHRGELKPGDQIPRIRALAQEFNVSRRPIEMVFNSLKREGFIRTVPTRGAFVQLNPPPKGKTPLTLCIPAGLHIQKTLEVLASDFSKMSDSRIDIVPCSIREISERLARGKGVDLTVLTEQQIYKPAFKKYVTNLSRHFLKNRDISPDDISRRIHAFAWKRESRIRFVPFLWAPVALVYRTDLFNPSTDTAISPDCTWEEFIPICKKVLANCPENKKFIGFDNTPILHVLSMLIYQYNGRMFNQIGNLCRLDTRQTADALKLYRELAEVHGIASPRYLSNYPGVDERTRPGINRDDYFLFGNTASMYKSFIFFQHYRNTAGDSLPFDICMPPLLRRDITRITFASLSVSDSSPHCEKAWEFIAYVLSKEAQLKIGQMMYGLPVRSDIPLSQFNAGAPVKNYGIFETMLKKMDFYIHAPHEEIDAILLKNVAYLLEGLVDEKTACRNIAGQINTFITKGRALASHRQISRARND